MIVKGIVFSGVLRGQPLIDIHFHRLIGLIGFEPYKGTLDVKLERTVDFRKYATKAVEHVLMDGKKIVNARLAPIKLIFKGHAYQCWAMQEVGGTQPEDTIELLAKDHLKSKIGLTDRDEVGVEFYEASEKKKTVRKTNSLLGGIGRKKK